MEEVQQKARSLKIDYTTFARINLLNIKQEIKTKPKQDMQKNNSSGRIIFILNSESNRATPPGKYPKLQVK